MKRGKSHIWGFRIGWISYRELEDEDFDPAPGVPQEIEFKIGNSFNVEKAEK